MSLQPIVENAITHGIEELDADAVIEIKGIEHEKSFEIEITDSGIGMSEKQLAILRRKLRMRLNSDTQPKHGGQNPHSIWNRVWTVSLYKRALLYEGEYSSSHHEGEIFSDGSRG